MFIKVTSSGPRRYVQLVEAYHDDQGRPKQRTVATLGRLDQPNYELESVISGLLRVTGKAPLMPPVVPRHHRCMKRSVSMRRRKWWWNRAGTGCA